MSEFDRRHSANGTPGEGSQPALPHHQSPSILPDENAQDSAGESMDPCEISVPSRAIGPAAGGAQHPAAAHPPRSRGRGGGTGAAGPEVTPLPAEPRRAEHDRRLVGAALGSAATAGILYMNGTPAAAPSDPMTFTAALNGSITSSPI